MTRSQPIDTGAAILTAMAAAAAGVAAYAGLAVLAHPPGLTKRVAEITRQADEVERLKRRLKAPSFYPAGAVCNTESAAAINALRQRLGSAASTTGVTLANVVTEPQTPDESISGLQPIVVTVDANGPYPSVIGLLQIMARSTPVLFIDKLDLKSENPRVSLKISGRIFCSTVKL